MKASLSSVYLSVQAQSHEQTAVDIGHAVLLEIPFDLIAFRAGLNDNALERLVQPAQQYDALCRMDAKIDDIDIPRPNIRCNPCPANRV